MLIDLHTHTQVRSPCSCIGVGELITGEKRYVEGIVLTEHDNLIERGECEELSRRFGFPVLPGVEISAWREKAHILAFGLKRDIRPGMGVSKTLRLIHDQGGVAVAAHPFRFIDSVDSFEWEGVDAVEVLTPKCSDRQNIRALRWAGELGVPGVGGSDVHDRAGIGSCVTSFEDTVEGIGDICEGIRGCRVHPIDLLDGV